MSTHRDPNIPPNLASFLSGAQAGRDKFDTITIERDQLEVAEKAAEFRPHLIIAGKIWADFKWELKKYKRTIPQAIDLINNAIIETGLKVKHEQLRKELVEKYQAMKEELEKKL